MIDFAALQDGEITEHVPCFGFSFSKVDAECGGCAVRARCVQRLVAVKIPEAMLAQRTELSTSAVMEFFENEEGTAEHLVQIVTGTRTLASILALPTPATTEDDATDTTESDEAPKEEVEVKPPKEEVEVKPPAKVKKEAKVKPPKEEVEVKPPAKEAKVKPPAKVKKEAKVKPPAKVKKEAKVKPPAKKKAPKSKRTPASSVQSRVDAAESPAGELLALWTRERARSPTVAALQPGTDLSRVYCGVHVEVIYEDGFVSFAGQRWPTLSSVKTAVVGKKVYPSQYGDGKTRRMTDWSVPRFFHLTPHPKEKAKGKKKVALKKKGAAA